MAGCHKTIVGYTGGKNCRPAVDSAQVAQPGIKAHHKRIPLYYLGACLFQRIGDGMCTTPSMSSAFFNSGIAS
jgi:hypothetical protein